MDLRRPTTAAVCTLALALGGCAAPRQGVPAPPGQSREVFSTPLSTPGASAAASGGPGGTPVAGAPFSLPAVTATAGLVTRGPAGVHGVLLTFDAGADRGFAPQILDTLAAAQVTATFGVTGLWAQQNPDLVRRMVAEGHVIINHTYDHRSFTGVSTHKPGLAPQERLDEIQHADAVLSQIAGRPIKPWFRFPYGDGNNDPVARAEVLQAGYPYVLGWTVDSLGWQGLPAAAIAQRCLSRAAPGAIYLFHVGSRSQDAVALPGIIDALKAQGYGFETAAALTP